jgi:hypothetical protein
LFNASLRSPVLTSGLQVSPATFISFVPLLLGLFVAEPGAIPNTVTRLVVQDEVIIRIPVQPRPPFPMVEWDEHKGPKCIPTAAIRRAMLSGSDQVDFVLADRSRIRAKFDEDCMALDFYAGFYIQPEDDRLCAHRDAIHSRQGATCRIEHFRQLMPRFRR